MLAVRQCRVMTGGPAADVYDPAEPGRFVFSPWAFSLRSGTRRAFAALADEVPQRTRERARAHPPTHARPPPARASADSDGSIPRPSPAVAPAPARVSSAPRIRTALLRFYALSLLALCPPPSPPPPPLPPFRPLCRPSAPPHCTLTRGDRPTARRARPTAQRSDERLVQLTSTSPLVEGPHFAAEMRSCLRVRGPRAARRRLCARPRRRGRPRARGVPSPPGVGVRPRAARVYVRVRVRPYALFIRVRACARVRALAHACALLRAPRVCLLASAAMFLSPALPAIGCDGGNRPSNLRKHADAGGGGGGGGCGQTLSEHPDSGSLFPAGLRPARFEWADGPGGPAWRPVALEPSLAAA